METYDLILLLVGIVLLGVSILPRFLDQKPISLPIFFVGFGVLVFSLPLDLPAVDPIEHGMLAERLAEVAVIIALMGVGLKIERPPGLASWLTTWRLLAITMPASIAAVALIGWWAGLLAPAALLLGACIAPTDPVLASEVQVREPQIQDEDDLTDEEGEPTGAEGKVRVVDEDEVRFALSSEAGLNDGLAFPFTNLAILTAVVGVAPQSWIVRWVLIDVVYKIAVGAMFGVLIGWILSYVIFHTAARQELARSLAGLEAVAGVFIVYGLTEFAGGYGFIAVFVAAVTIRQREREHHYHEQLHDTVEIAEHVVMAVIMFFFGGALAGGVLAPLSLTTWAAALAIVFLVRPLAGMVALIGRYGTPLGWGRRGVIAFFGVRGLGTFFYLAHGLNQTPFPDERMVWAIASAVVLVSIIVHGTLATPTMKKLDGLTPRAPRLEP